MSILLYKAKHSGVKMFCSKCGTKLTAKASFCPNCGNPSFQTPQSATVAAPVQAPSQNYAPTSGLAITAFILSLTVSLVGLILGYMARNEIRDSNGTKSGSELATAAIIIGWIFTSLGFAAIIFWVLVVAIAAGTASSY
jgi:ribosomal protein S27AE